MSDHTLNLSPALNDYVQQNSVYESAVLNELQLQTQKMSMSQMQITPEIGQFLQILIKLLGAKKTLEVGVFTGYSTLCVAMALPEDGKMIVIDRNIEWTKIAKRFWEKANMAHKITLQLADATAALDQLLAENQAGSFDFVFIDADKKNYDVYYEKSLQLVRSGGLIAIDNTLLGGKVADEAFQDQNTQHIRQFNAKLYKDKRVIISLLPMRDGLTLVRKN